MKETKQCLIVDDDQDDQEIFQMCLKKISDKITCKTADNGIEALELLMSKDAFVPDYIFLDVNMPKMNGIECLKKIKEIDRLKKTRVFMYSTTSESKVEKEIKELGAEEFIIKPSKTQELKDKLSKIFNICSEIDR